MNAFFRSAALMAVVMLTAAGCAAPNSPTSSSSAPATPAQSLQATPADKTTVPKTEPSASVVSQRPATKTGTIAIEGMPETINLKLFDREGVPFTTYMQADRFVDEVVDTAEGSTTRLYWTYEGQKEESVFVEFTFPDTAMTADEMQSSLTAPDGLMNQQGWKVMGVEPASKPVYPWLKTAIAYEDTTAPNYTVGRVLVAEHDGKAFYIVTHVPAEYGDGLSPRIEMMLKELEFK